MLHSFNRVLIRASNNLDICGQLSKSEHDSLILEAKCEKIIKELCSTIMGAPTMY